MYLTMNYDLTVSMLILTKIKIMKYPASRRLKTWNIDIFTEFCPFGCVLKMMKNTHFLTVK